MPRLIWQIIKSEELHQKETSDMYLSLLGNLSLWSVTKTRVAKAKTDALKQEDVLRRTSLYKYVSFLSRLYIFIVAEPIDTTTRNEPLDLAVYNLACVQSCTGKNPASFWQKRRQLLLPETRTVKNKKTATKSTGRAYREIDLWQ